VRSRPKAAIEGRLYQYLWKTSDNRHRLLHTGAIIAHHSATTFQSKFKVYFAPASKKNQGHLRAGIKQKKALPAPVTPPQHTVWSGPHVNIGLLREGF